MEENNELIQSAMHMILHAGNARSKTKEALRQLAYFDFPGCKALMNQAKEDITKAHKAQTTIIQDEAAGKKQESCLLFTHAQDTLMTIMSEVELATELIVLFEAVDHRYLRKEGSL